MYKKIRTWIMLALTLLIGLGTNFGVMPTATAAESQQASRNIICKGLVVPEGYVITAHTYTPNCATIRPFLENAWVIQLPSEGTTRVCQGQELPEGYVIISHIYTVSCPEVRPNLPNTWVIQLPGDMARICQGQEVPDGYTIVGHIYTLHCPSIGPSIPNTWVIERL